jgi:hypothetical protein
VVAVAGIIDALVAVVDAHPDWDDRWAQLAEALSLLHALGPPPPPSLQRYQRELAWWRQYHLRGTEAHS